MTLKNINAEKSRKLKDMNEEKQRKLQEQNEERERRINTRKKLQFSQVDASDPHAMGMSEYLKKN